MKTRPPSTKPSRRALFPTLIGMAILSLSSACTSSLRVDQPPPVDQVQRLLHHPQLPQVQQHAPDWGREALTIINDQQREIQKLKAQ